MRSVLKKLFFAISLAVLPLSALHGEISNPDLSIGMTAMAGTNNIEAGEQKFKADPGNLFGAGFIIEKGITDFFSLGSGIEYRYFENDFSFISYSSVEYDGSWSFHAISVPFHLIGTLKGNSSSINICAGLTLTRIFSSQMKTSDGVAENGMDFINPNQLAISGGMIFKFLVTEYTDFFMGVMTEYYFRSLLNEESVKDMHLVNYYFRAGYLFRTDVF